MKVLLDIQDNKANKLLKTLEGLPYVKIEQLTGEKAELLSELKEAIEEVKLILDGKKEAKNAEQFLNEL